MKRIQNVSGLSENTLKIAQAAKEYVTQQQQDNTSAVIDFYMQRGHIPFNIATQAGLFASKGRGIYKEAKRLNDPGRIWVTKEIVNANGETEKWLVKYTDENEEVLRDIQSAIESSALALVVTGNVRKASSDAENLEEHDEELSFNDNRNPLEKQKDEMTSSKKTRKLMYLGQKSGGHKLKAWQDSEMGPQYPQIADEMISQLIDDIENGAGWATDEYALLQAHEMGLNEPDTFKLLMELAKKGLLFDENVVGEEQTLSELEDKGIEPMIPANVARQYGKLRNRTASLQTTSGSELYNTWVLQKDDPTPELLREIYDAMMADNIGPDNHEGMISWLTGFTGSEVYGHDLHNAIMNVLDTGNVNTHTEEYKETMSSLKKKADHALGGNFGVWFVNQYNNLPPENKEKINRALADMLPEDMGAYDDIQFHEFVKAVDTLSPVEKMGLESIMYSILGIKGSKTAANQLVRDKVAKALQRAANTDLFSSDDRVTSVEAFLASYPNNPGRVSYRPSEGSLVQDIREIRAGVYDQHIDTDQTFWISLPDVTAAQKAPEAILAPFKAQLVEALKERFRNPEDFEAHDKVQNLLVQIFTAAGLPVEQAQNTPWMEDEVYGGGSSRSVAHAINQVLDEIGSIQNGEYSQDIENGSESIQLTDEQLRGIYGDDWQNIVNSSRTAAQVDPKNIPLAPGIKSKNITLDESGGGGTAKVTIEFTDPQAGLDFYHNDVVAAPGGDEAKGESTEEVSPQPSPETGQQGQQPAQGQPAQGPQIPQPVASSLNKTAMPIQWDPEDNEMNLTGPDFINFKNWLLSLDDYDLGEALGATFDEQEGTAQIRNNIMKAKSIDRLYKFIPHDSLGYAMSEFLKLKGTTTANLKKQAGLENLRGRTLVNKEDIDEETGQVSEGEYEVYFSDDGYIELIQGPMAIDQYQYPEPGESAPQYGGGSSEEDGIYYNDMEGYLEFFENNKVIYTLYLSEAVTAPEKSDNLRPDGTMASLNKTAKIKVESLDQLKGRTLVNSEDVEFDEGENESYVTGYEVYFSDDGWIELIEDVRIVEKYNYPGPDENAAEYGEDDSEIGGVYFNYGEQYLEFYEDQRVIYTLRFSEAVDSPNGDGSPSMSLNTQASTYTETLMNHGQELRQILSRFTTIRNQYQSNLITEGDIDKALERISMYEANLPDYIWGWITGQRPSEDEIVRLGIENQNRYGTEPSQVIYALDTFTLELLKHQEEYDEDDEDFDEWEEQPPYPGPRQPLSSLVANEIDALLSIASLSNNPSSQGQVPEPAQERRASNRNRASINTNTTIQHVAMDECGRWMEDNWNNYSKAELIKKAAEKYGINESEARDKYEEVSALKHQTESSLNKKADFVKDVPESCPECGSDDLDVDDSDERQEFKRVKVSCNDCDWYDEYMVAKHPEDDDISSYSALNKEGSNYQKEDFYNGMRVKLTPEYQDKPGEEFVLSQYDETTGKGWIGDANGRGWYAKWFQLIPVEDSDEFDDDDYYDDGDEMEEVESTINNMLGIKTESKLKVGQKLARNTMGN